MVVCSRHNPFFCCVLAAVGAVGAKSSPVAFVRRLKKRNVLPTGRPKPAHRHLGGPGLVVVSTVVCAGVGGARCYTRGGPVRHTPSRSEIDGSEKGRNNEHARRIPTSNRRARSLKAAILLFRRILLSIPCVNPNESQRLLRTCDTHVVRVRLDLALSAVRCRWLQGT